MLEPFSILEEGIEFQFRGTKRDNDGQPVGDFVCARLVVPPLNLDSLKREGEHLTTMVGDASLASMEAVVSIVVRALAQNYKSVPRWLVEQSLNVGNVADMSRAVMDVSGLMRKDIEVRKALAAALVTATPSAPPDRC